MAPFWRIDEQCLGCPADFDCRFYRAVHSDLVRPRLAGDGAFPFTPGKRSGRDWNFETMSSPASTQPSFARVPGNEAKELYEYPGRFLDTDGAETMMRNRIQATETGFETVEAV